MMKNYMLTIISLVIVVSHVYGNDPITESDYLLITHPTLSGEWIDDLIDLQTERGFKVGVYQELENGVTTNENIRAFIYDAYSTGVQVKYVLLAGAGATIYDGTLGFKGYAGDSQRTESNIVNDDENNFIPFCYETHDIIYWGETQIPTDDLYIWDENNEWLNGISIGRIPARTENEMNIFITKLNEYYSTFKFYNHWQENSIFLSQDFDCDITNCDGFRLDQMYDAVFDYINYEEINDSIYFIKATNLLEETSAFYQCGEKEIIFENEIMSKMNNGVALINYMGTSAGPNHLGGFLWAQDTENQSNFSLLTNSGKYPFLNGMSCNIGRTQFPNDDFSLIRDLLFLPNKGIISSFAPTILTEQWGCQELSKRFFNIVYNENSIITGEVSHKSKIVLEEEVSVRTWMSRGFILYGDPSMPLSLFQHKETDILENTVWNGSIVVEGNITIQSGATLSIKPGTGIFFTPGSHLMIAEGATLNAVGTETFPIVFAPATEDEYDNDYWFGIKNWGEINLNHCEIKGARIGLNISQGSGNISQTLFNKNTTGLNLIYSDYFTIDHCTFTKNETGVQLLYSSPYLTHNFISDNRDYGIYAYRSNSKLRNNTIQNNGIYGVKISNRSMAGFIANHPTDSPTVNNVFENNGVASVRIDANCRPNFGMYREINGQTYGGFNHFINHDNSFNILNNSRLVYADVNWWENMNTIATASIHTDPTADRLFGPLAKTTGSDQDLAPPQLEQALLLELDSNFTEALPLFQSVISDEPDGDFSVNALYGIIRSYTGLENDDELDNELLDYFSEYPDYPIGIAAYDYSITQKAHLEDYDDAIDRSITLAEIVENTENEAHVLLEQGILYELMENNGLGDAPKQTQSLTELAQSNYTFILENYPESSASEIAAWLLGERHINNVDYFEKQIIPSIYSMSQNYPNPFNPITTLKYELPERSRIKLQIFDISGRLVSTITDNEQTAGIHITQWRGTNEQGETVSSGMYFIRLEAQSRISDKHFQKSQKIILLK